MPRQIAGAEVCEMCATPIDERHPHLVDMRDRRLLCACRACHMLFVPDGAAQGRYRAVGTRVAALPRSLIDGPQFDALQIPIGLAFLFFNSATNRVEAFYPGAAGATQSELSMDAWTMLVSEEPLLQTMQPDIEAALVYRRRGGTSEAYVVPIDACYELVALVRMAWQGFDGGDDARERIEGFFARIRGQCA
ncbi:MAG TPA: DUF5947 family protein [Candidatus Baltobacteraceae bacterium]|nr:DUF5947 family protein [Candidatus Baltobacteraceae bacterium]